MKLKDYIQHLQGLDGELEVCKVSDNFELNGAIVPVSDYYRPRVQKMTIAKESFRDTFDGGTYESTVLHYDNSGKEVIIL